MPIAITNDGTNLAADFPLEAVSLYTKICELEAMPGMVYDSESWVEPKGEFKAARTENVYWTVYGHMTPSVEPLAETTDKEGRGITEYRVSFTVNEYGDSVEWTQKAQEFHWTDPGVEEKVRTVLAPSMAASRDVLCRNAWIAGLVAKNRMVYANATSRAAIPATGYLTTTLCEDVLERMTEELHMASPHVTVLAHRRALTNLRRSTTDWVSTAPLAVPGTMINQVIGQWGNMSFIEAPRGVLPNAGAATFTGALSASAARGQAYFVTSTATCALLTAHLATAANGRSVMTLGLTTGDDDTAETVTVDSIADVNMSTGRVDLAGDFGLKNDHAQSEPIYEGVDIYPVIFFVSGTKPMGRGDVITPHVDKAPVVDKHMRIHSLGWYGLFGYGLIRHQLSFGIEVTAPSLSV